MKTILITGSNGFIGSHLVEKLSKTKKYRLILVDKTYDKEIITKNLIILKGDISKERTIDKIIQLSKRHINIIVHLAARIYGKKFRRFYEDNIIGTRNIIRLCKEVKCKKLIFTSTDFVIVKMKNNYYRLTKIVNENDIINSKCRYSILRLSPVFGIDDKKNFGKLKRLLERIPFIIIPRCFINPVSIEKVIRILINEIEKDGNKKIEYINGDFITLKQVVKSLSEIIGKKILILELPISIFGPFVFLQEKILNDPLLYYYQLTRWKANRKLMKVISK